MATVRDGRCNCIAVLDAVPDGELNTARRLCETLRDIADYESQGLRVIRFRVHTKEDVDAAMASLEVRARTEGLLPWIHLEGHGSSDEAGFLAADGAMCSWTELKNLLVPINVATNLNVVLVLATCYGGSFARAIETTDRAPVLGLLGPTREITVGDIEADFPAFYRTFLMQGSIKQALTALTSRAGAGLYWATNATQFFAEVWAGYKANECNPSKRTQRAGRMYRELKAKNLPRTPTVGHLKRFIASDEERQFNLFRDTYFMCDLHPNNRARFPVTYRRGEAHIAG